MTYTFCINQSHIKLILSKSIPHKMHFPVGLIKRILIQCELYVGFILIKLILCGIDFDKMNFIGIGFEQLNFMWNLL